MNQQDLDEMLKPKGFQKGSLEPYREYARKQGIYDEVNTIIIQNVAGPRIHVYGKHIKDGTIFAGLNLSIGIPISYKDESQLRFYQHVQYKEGEIFGKKGEVVGLVGIDTDSDELEIIDYDPSDF